jgi:hypothetical protein
MTRRDRFWELEHFSDGQLLESLSGVMTAQRQRLAELIAHLAEVEQRRIHLLAAHASMFSYCVGRLGMSEDEACRRIEVARLARRFPALFGELANGQIGLSVAVLLKPVLTSDNHADLLAAARGKTMQQTRELIAERFPKPDVPSSFRKLPERRSTPAVPTEPAHASLPLLLAPAVSAAPAPAPASSPQAPASVPLSPASPIASGIGASTMVETSTELPMAPTPAGTPRSSKSLKADVEPLSPRRYRIQFTADADLKEKLERARDLLRHALPSGDFAPILARALDLLLDELLRARFGARSRRVKRSKSHTRDSSLSIEASSPRTNSSLAASAPPEQPPSSPTTSDVAPAHRQVEASRRAPTPRPNIPRPERRAVLERDGLGCRWVSADGLRCGSHAWLELDHRQPAGRGGSSHAENLRYFCRAHNHLAAEQAYGREHMQQAIATRRRRRGTEREA